MTTLRGVFILLVALVLGIFFVLPQEDLPETAYDESESLPYEGAPLFSSDAVQDAVDPALPVPVYGFPVCLVSPTGRDEIQAAQGERATHPVSELLVILNQSLRC